MQQGSLCPRCGGILRYIPEYGNWYCDICSVYPFIQPQPMSNYKRPFISYSGSDLLLKVIAGIILLLIIAAFILFFLFLSNAPNWEPEVTPHGTLLFTESVTTDGLYEGRLIAIGEIVPLRDVSLSIFDASLGSTATLDRLVNEDTAQVPGGINCTFFDIDGDVRLDTSDSFVIHNGDAGDTITLTFRSTGGEIASFTLN